MSVKEDLLKAAELIRTLSAENSELKQQLTTYSRKDEAQKIAMDMSKKNLIGKDDVLTKAEELVEQDSDLDVIKAAVKIAETLPDTSSTWDGLDSPVSPSDPDDMFNKWVSS